MEAPEKIYLQPISKNEIYNHWYRDKLTNDFIEYSRTDAFIDKACRWLEENAGSYLLYPFCEYDKGSLIKDFKKAMKEE